MARACHEESPASERRPEGAWCALALPDLEAGRRPWTVIEPMIGWRRRAPGRDGNHGLRTLARHSLRPRRWRRWR